MADSKTNENSESANIDVSKPTWQDIKKGILAVMRAAIDDKKDKDKGVLKNYKKRLVELRQSEYPDEYVIEKAKKLFPNEKKYTETMENNRTWYKNEREILKAIERLNSLYYEIAKDYFMSEEEIDRELEEYINSED